MKAEVQAPESIAFEVNGEPHAGTHLVAWDSEVTLRLLGSPGATFVRWTVTPKRSGQAAMRAIPVRVDRDPKSLRASFRTPVQSDPSDVMWIEVGCEVGAAGGKATRRSAVLLLPPEQSAEQILGHDLQLLAKLRSLVRVAPTLPDSRYLPLATVNVMHRGRLLDDATDMSFRRIAMSWCYTVIEGILKGRLRANLRQKAASPDTYSAESEREELVLRVFFHDEPEFEIGSRAQYRAQLELQWKGECPAAFNRPPALRYGFKFGNDDKATAFGRYLLIRQGLPLEASMLDVDGIPRRSLASSEAGAVPLEASIPTHPMVSKVEDLVRRFLVLKAIRNLWIHSGTPTGRDRFAAARLDTDISSFMLNPRGWVVAAETVRETLEMLLGGKAAVEEFADHMAGRGGSLEWMNDLSDALASIGELEPPPEPVNGNELVAIQAAQLDKVRRWLTYEASPEEASAYLTAERLERLERAGQELADALMGRIGVNESTLRDAVEAVERVRRSSAQWPGLRYPAMPAAFALRVDDSVAKTGGFEEFTQAVSLLRDAIGTTHVTEAPFWAPGIDEAIATRLAPVATQGRVALHDDELAAAQVRQVKICALAYEAANQTRFYSYMAAVVQLFSSVLPARSDGRTQAMQRVVDRIGLIGDASIAFKLFADDPDSNDAPSSWREHLAGGSRPVPGTEGANR